MANYLNFKDRELERYSILIQEYTDNISELEQAEKEIEEKYRLKMEQEKKDITEALTFYRNLLNKRTEERDSLLSDIKQEMSVDEPKQVKEETPAVVEEKVVDTIFPENNVEEPEEE